MFTLDNKEYDETKISNKAKAALEEVVRVSQSRSLANSVYFNFTTHP